MFCRFEPFDPVGGPSIALNETQGVLDVGHKPTVKVLAIQDVNLVLALCQQTGDVGLREEMTHVTGEEEHPRISEEQFVSHSLGCLNVGQHVLDRRLAGYAGMTEPSVELLAVEVLRVPEPRAG
jgi:hypothetical protein